MLCAGDPDFPRPTPSACSRDSGGPLAVRRGGRWSLLGVVSWGLRCGAEGDPTVFTDVPAARAFAAAAAPVWAPIASSEPATVTGEPRVGATLTCAAPPFVTPPEEVLYRWTSIRFQRGIVVRQESPSPAYIVRSDRAARRPGRASPAEASTWTLDAVWTARPDPRPTWSRNRGDASTTST
jgi:hypothetical protein